MAVAERFSTSLAAWMTAHALGCLIAMAHRCVSLGAFTARSERMGTTLSAVAPQQNGRPLGRSRIALAAACSTADWHGVADLRRKPWASFPVRNRRSGGDDGGASEP